MRVPHHTNPSPPRLSPILTKNQFQRSEPELTPTHHRATLTPSGKAHRVTDTPSPTSPEYPDDHPTEQKAGIRANVIGLGVSLGAGIGIAIGAVIDNIVWGLVLGVALGPLIGVIFQQTGKSDN